MDTTKLKDRLGDKLQKPTETTPVEIAPTLEDTHYLSLASNSLDIIRANLKPWTSLTSSNRPPEAPPPSQSRG